MTVTASDAKRFCDSRAFGDWRKSKESESKVQAAVVDRLNGVIRSIGALAKSLSKR